MYVVFSHRVGGYLLENYISIEGHTSPLVPQEDKYRGRCKNFGKKLKEHAQHQLAQIATGIFVFCTENQQC